MNKLDFIYKRYSIRKFADASVPEADLTAILAAAVHAPSGKNQQNWHFVVVRKQELIAQMAEAVRQKNKYLQEYVADEKARKIFGGMIPYHTVFKAAPVVILLYAGAYPGTAEMLLQAGVMPTDEAQTYGQAHPGIQNASAAMENLLLAAAALGYGTCWMTGPCYAAAEISQLVGFHKDGYQLVALTPLGIPANPAAAVRPPRKPLSEVVTWID